ncbi:vascular cell adhesion protein 1-like [Poeciliopsis prolifica]|uniref:vascular cell adhesion protein 1-like n=1 Tax=Poeciliopsis prolifica TaxID=188132 RepID=UPI002412E7E3|nr:vascular cell adhesion protein 1-like [Poeciliopsis prolifica]
MIFFPQMIFTHFYILICFRDSTVMAALTENMLTVNMLLSVFFLPGALAEDCYGITPAFNITTPNTMEALTGSCLQIPCTYDTENTKYNSSRRIYAVWMKGDTQIHLHPKVVIFNSSGTVNTYQLEIIGNLKEKICTTLFPNLTTRHADKYFFRIENYQFRATACANPLQIKVKDSPWSPSIYVPSDLKEHQSVTVTCSAFTPCPNSPPELTWNLQQDSLRHTEKNRDGTFTTKIQEIITLSDTHDGYNISCSARYSVIGGIKTAETEVTLSVSYAPKDTSASISPSGLVSAGSWVELSCSSRAKPPPTFTWFRISEHGDINVSVGQIYSFNVTEGGEYYCVASNDLGQQKSPVILVAVEDDQASEFQILNVLKILGIVLLCTGVIIFECWFRFYNKPKKEPEEPTYVNNVMVTTVS